VRKEKEMKSRDEGKHQLRSERKLKIQVPYLIPPTPMSHIVGLEVKRR
jgi:hypothetical protein